MANDTSKRNGQKRAGHPARSIRQPLTAERSPTGWVLRDPDLARLTGFDALPLPLTPEAAPAEVLAHLQRLNPHREVRLDTPPHLPCA